MKKVILFIAAAAAIWGCGKDKEAPLVPDTSGPRVSVTSPGDGDSNVALNALVTVTFNEDVDPLTITGSSFYLGGSLPGTITYGSRSAALDPDADFQYGTTYMATITTAVTDAAGNHMDSNFVWSFTTEFGDIMPLAVGNRWEYQVINYTNPVVPDTSYDTILVVGDTTIDSEQWFILDDGVVMTNRNDGLWRMTDTGTPYLWLRFPGIVGQTYDADPTRGESVEIKSVSQLTSGPPLPRLFYCYVYESSYTDPNTLDIYHFEPRTGPIILTHDTVNVFTTVLERWKLIRYQLQ